MDRQQRPQRGGNGFAAELREARPPDRGSGKAGRGKKRERQPLLPEAGSTVTGGDPLSALGTGILEYVFEPQTAGAPPMHVVGTSAQTVIPDLRALAVEKVVGDYTWTVRRFPTMTAVENMWGADARRYRPVAISAPRSFSLR